MWFNDLTGAHFPAAFGGSPAKPLHLPKRWLLAQPGMTVRRTATGGYQFDFAYPLRLLTDADAERILDAIVEHLLSLSPAQSQHRLGLTPGA